MVVGVEVEQRVVGGGTGGAVVAVGGGATEALLVALLETAERIPTGAGTVVSSEAVEAPALREEVEGGLGQGTDRWLPS